jgi:hypothetical protein
MLADAAQVVDGKLYLLGGAWNRYHCHAFPTQAAMAFAVSVLVDWEDSGRRFPVTLALVDEAGVPIIPEITAQAEVGRPEGERTQHRTLLTVSANIMIPAPAATRSRRRPAAPPPACRSTRCSSASASPWAPARSGTSARPVALVRAG